MQVYQEDLRRGKWEDVHLQAGKFKDVEKKNVSSHEWNIYWPNTIALVLVHVIGLYARFQHYEHSAGAHVFLKLYTFMTLVTTTAGMHRLFCHKTYKANKYLQVFMMMAVSTIHQNSIYTWCRDHRVHHKYSETEADPHNANRGFFFSHVGWLMLRKSKEVKEKGKLVDMSDLEANPIVMFQHKYYIYVVLLFGVIIPVFVPCYFWGEPFMITLLYGTIYRYIVSLNIQWTVNSLAHTYGQKPYDKNIGPVESAFCELITGGEGFHNYHHTFPWDYKAAESGEDTRNVAAYLIKILAYFGWATELKAVPQSVIDKRMAISGDGTTKENDTFPFTRLSKRYRKIVLNTIYSALFWYMVYVL